MVSFLHQLGISVSEEQFEELKILSVIFRFSFNVPKFRIIIVELKSWLGDVGVCVLASVI
jgi:hypothetical protein